MKKIIGLVSVLALSGAAHLVAEDVSASKDFYVAASGNMAFVGKQRSEDKTAVASETVKLTCKHKKSFGGAFEVGSHVAEDVRLGLQVRYNQIKAKDEYTKQVGSAAATTEKFSAIDEKPYKLSQLAFLVNGYYDLAIADDFGVTFGLGVGGAQVKTGKIEFLNDKKISKWVFAAQATVGLFYNVTDALALFVNYNCLFTGAPKTTIKYTEDIPAVPAVGSTPATPASTKEHTLTVFKKSMIQHGVEVGMRFSF